MSVLLRSRPARRLVVAAAAASTLLLAACGSGSSNSLSSGGDTTGASTGAPTTSSSPAQGSGSGSSASGLPAGAPVAPASAIPAGSTMEKIKQRGELIVGGSIDAPLLSQKNPTTGQVEGFDAYMGQALATYIFGSPKVKIVSSATQTREALLQNHTVDVVFQTYSITPERAKQVTFVGPDFESGDQIAVRSDNTSITKPEDLAGKIVIAGANTPAIAEIKKIAPTAKIVTFDTDPECIQALKQGRGEAYVQNTEILAGDLLQNKDLKVVGAPFTQEPEGIGVPKDQPDMAKFVNDWLKQIIDSGYWNKIWQASFGTVMQGVTPTPPVVGSDPNAYQG